MELIHLIGAEAVENAGHAIRGAADQFQHAVSNLGGEMERQRRYMDDWLARFENAVGKLVETRQEKG